ncbi:MAG: tripartite tricarboxylate transporter TctB family protein [Deltaproteobacteria bacterium]|nr:tripartite tricarboxylate transporter TctB family protein [Deltaproteobacteria bacterium]
MNKDQSSSLAWLAFALFICAETLRRLSLGSWRDPGPGFVPVLSGVILGILALVHFIHSYLKKSRESGGLWVLPERWKALLFVIISLFVSVFLLEPLGFVTATFLLLIILFRAAEPHPWIVVFGGSALTSFITYLLFDVFLKCQLPKGILGF